MRYGIYFIYPLIDFRIAWRCYCLWALVSLYHNVKQRTDHNTRNSVSYSLWTVCGFVYIPESYEHWRVVRPGLWFIVLNRRLEILSICRCHYKSGTFSSVIQTPWVLVLLWFCTCDHLYSSPVLNWANQLAESFMMYLYQGPPTNRFLRKIAAWLAGFKLVYNPTLRCFETTEFPLRPKIAESSSMPPVRINAV